MTIILDRRPLVTAAVESSSSHEHAKPYKHLFHTCQHDRLLASRTFPSLSISLYPRSAISEAEMILATGPGHPTRLRRIRDLEAILKLSAADIVSNRDRFEFQLADGALEPRARVRWQGERFGMQVGTRCGEQIFLVVDDGSSCRRGRTFTDGAVGARGCDDLSPQRQGDHDASVK